MMYSDWGRRLSERFPSRDAAEAEREWASLKQRLLPGQTVTGIVLTKAPFGAWLDIGVGFPALLEIACIVGLTPEGYHSDDWCAVGSEVTALVGTFNDRNHQVGLRQVKPGEESETEPAHAPKAAATSGIIVKLTRPARVIRVHDGMRKGAMTRLRNRRMSFSALVLSLPLLFVLGCTREDTAMTTIKLEEFQKTEKGIGRTTFTGYKTPEGKIVAHGPYCFTSEDDLSREEGICKHGLRDGTWKEYHENGRLAAVSEYRDGKLHGRQSGWYDDGTLQSEVDCEDNHAHGMTRKYHPNGNLKEEAEYKHGFRHGLCRVWSETGELVAQGAYQDGEPFDGTFVVREEIQPSPELPTFADYMDAVINRRSAVVTYRGGEYINGKPSN